MFAFVTPPAPPPTSLPELEPAAEVRAARDRSSDERASQRLRDRWMLALEAALHAPSDVSLQASAEFPFRLRVSGGVGLMPVDWVTNFIANATSDDEARAILSLPAYRGTIWRAQVGYRPFRKLGFYFEGGYAHVDIHGSLTLSGSPFADELGVRGAYSVDSSLDLWLLEAGHQWKLGERGVIALGLGVMSTFHANTTATATDDAPSSSSELDAGVRRANDALESYGTLPFVSVRTGVDLL
jgi:hypothetical protein